MEGWGHGTRSWARCPGPFPVPCSGRASGQRYSVRGDDKQPLSTFTRPGVASALGIEQETQQCLCAQVHDRVWGGGRHGRRLFSCGLRAGRWQPGVPQGTLGLTASPPAGSWAGVVRVAASLQKASARPCSSSMTSRRCGSRCECAQPVRLPVSLSTWLCLLRDSPHCLTLGKRVGSEP